MNSVEKLCSQCKVLKPLEGFRVVTSKENLLKSNQLIQGI